eukprot:TRINITY_DN2059_c0_g1_i2.p1 TRINITY_DN2059_c0_g1~~TRINITY_DN2059_c0_g1_i2.p1  ORF type:complete len:665 (+),score=234.96 TRINITY_DN2059_c0_g1_i2:110-1996(+)
MAVPEVGTQPEHPLSPASAPSACVEINQDSKLAVSLAWDNLGWTVKTKNGGEKHILNNLYGNVEPGEVLSILGPSGSGKTSLLSILSGLRPPTRGSIHFNGREKAHSTVFSGDVMGYRGNAAYVQQTDALIGSLTVRQTLRYAGKLKMSSAQAQATDLDAKVDQMMEILGLTSCADTIVGTVFQTGISGGQKRRVSIGVEIMSDPALIFLDEPTSGLDANSAYQIIDAVNDLSKAGHTIVMTVHQPSSQVFTMMSEMGHKMMILESGRLVYFGKVKDSTGFFGEAGFAVPALSNPFDHYLDVVNSQFTKSTANSDATVQCFTDTRLKKLMAQVDKSLTESKTWSIAKCEGSSFFTQVLTLVKRNLYNNALNPAIYGVRLVMYAGLCLCIGSLYYNIGKDPEDRQDRISVLFFVAAFLTFMSISGMPAFVEEKDVYVRERVNNHYSALAYVVANTVASAPFVFLISLVSSLLVVFMVQSGGDFWIYLANLFTALMVAESMMLAISAVSPMFMVGLAAGAGLLGIYMCVCGFFLTPKNIPSGWKWVHHGVSFHTYSFQNFMINDFEHYRGNGWNGTEVLNFYEMDADDLGFNFGILAVMCFVYRLLFFIFLRVFNTGSHVPVLQLLGCRK